jgi:hypothetical protein
MTGVKVSTAVLVTAVLALLATASPSGAQDATVLVAGTATTTKVIAKRTPLQIKLDKLSERVISGAADEDERRELQDFLTCVSDRVNAAPKASQSGLGVSATLEGMVRDCAAALGATLHGAVMSDGGAVLEIGRPDGSRPGFVCAQRGVDPRLAGRVYTVLEIAQRAEERARVARDRAAAYDDKAKAASDAGNKHQAAGYKALKALTKSSPNSWSSRRRNSGTLESRTAARRPSPPASLPPATTSPHAPPPPTWQRRSASA